MATATTFTRVAFPRLKAGRTVSACASCPRIPALCKRTNCVSSRGRNPCSRFAARSVRAASNLLCFRCNSRDRWQLWLAAGAVGNRPLCAESLLHPFSGAHAQLPAGAHVQLMFDVFPVALDRLHAQAQRLRDLPCAKPRAEQLENVHLAIG